MIIVRHENLEKTWKFFYKWHTFSLLSFLHVLIKKGHFLKKIIEKIGDGPFSKFSAWYNNIGYFINGLEQVQQVYQYFYEKPAEKGISELILY